METIKWKQLSGHITLPHQESLYTAWADYNVRLDSLSFKSAEDMAIQVGYVSNCTFCVLRGSGICGPIVTDDHEFPALRGVSMSDKHGLYGVHDQHELYSVHPAGRHVAPTGPHCYSIWKIVMTHVTWNMIMSRGRLLDIRITSAMTTTVGGM